MKPLIALLKKPTPCLPIKTEWDRYLCRPAEATPVAMGHHLDGRVSGMCGTHTHVQTSDEQILPGGTAYLTDAGMTGPKQSIIGCEIKAVLKNFTTGMPARFQPADTRAALEGAIIDVDHLSGKARSIDRVRIFHDTE